MQQAFSIHYCAAAVTIPSGGRALFCQLRMAVCIKAKLFVISHMDKGTDKNIFTHSSLPLCRSKDEIPKLLSLTQ